MNITDLFRRMDYKDLNRVYCISLLLHGLYGLEDFGDRETLNFIRDGFDDEDFSDITYNLEEMRSAVISEAIPWQSIEEDIKAVLIEKERKIHEEFSDRTAKNSSE